MPIGTHTTVAVDIGIRFAILFGAAVVEANLRGLRRGRRHIEAAFHCIDGAAPLGAVLVTANGDHSATQVASRCNFDAIIFIGVGGLILDAQKLGQDSGVGRLGLLQDAVIGHGAVNRQCISAEIQGGASGDQQIVIDGGVFQQGGAATAFHRQIVKVDWLKPLHHNVIELIITSRLQATEADIVGAGSGR